MADKVQGLSSSEATKKLQEYGKNHLPEKPPPSPISIFFSQFKNPLVYVLLAAGIVTFFLGDYSDTAIIFFVVFINSILGFIQEQRASNALASLRAMVQPTAEVIRDGKKITVDVQTLVPGDIVDLDLGEKIPADGVLIEANRLLIEEAILTGESVPVEKKAGDNVYMGTIVSTGKAFMKVEGTGANTEMGKIAVSVQKPAEDTPLTKQLKIFSNQLTILVVILAVLVFVIGFLTGKDLVEIFETSVALAVSSIPEGLLVALTVVLALGMQRILKKKGLIRNLVSAETLGGVTTICVDKTGTLTYGKLEVVEEYGDVEKVCTQHFASSDDPIQIAADEWIRKNTTHFKDIEKQFKEDCHLIDFIPFNPQNRFYATLIEHKDGNKEVYVNGAPEHLLEWSVLPAEEVKMIKQQIIDLTKEGKRVIGMAMKDVPETVRKISDEKVKKGLIWVGLLVFTDPVRKDVRMAFEQTKKAGIKTIIITGDYAETAIAVINEINMDISKERVITGDNLEKMSVDEVSQKLLALYKSGSGAILFARTKPEQKLKVINALKKNGETVAMMGDGVNDAPALHRADIGIVVGNATDVAKESADLVLLDSSFETIVDTVREGRGIFDNIRKIILYLLSDSFEEIIAVLGTMIFVLPLPVSAVQILWINIVSDGFPHLSLTVDPKVKDIMSRPPVSPKENIVSKWMKELIITVSLAGGIIAFSMFFYFLRTTGDLMLARSIAFATLGINSLVYVFSIRTLTEPFWKENPLDNKWLNVAVITGLFFQILPFTTPALRKFFEVETLTIENWLVVFAASALMFLIIELSKVVFKIEERHKSHYLNFANTPTDRVGIKRSSKQVCLVKQNNL
jgi:Ca2+-transporting ATPase